MAMQVFCGNGTNKMVVLEQLQSTTKLVTELTELSDDTQYPSAKCVYDLIEQLQAENEQLLSQIPIATATGETINVQDSSNLPPKDFAMLGNATQYTTTGKNILDIVNNFYSHPAGGSYATYALNDKNGIYRVSGGGGWGWSYNNAQVKVSLAPGAYTFSNFGNVSINIYKSDGTALQTSIGPGTAYTFTLTETTSLGFCVKPYGDNEVSYMMLESGTTTFSNYELYTGGKASPNPDYPQNINVVTGDNTIEIVGKNLFNGIFAVGGISISTGLYSGAADRIRTNEYIRINPSTQYALSFQNSGSVYFLEYDIYKNYIGYTNIIYHTTSGTVTTNANTAFCQFYYIPYQHDLTTNEICQLEQNSTATSYTPYVTPTTQLISLGNIELAKIGDYTDRIFKDNGKWYVEKKIGKIASYNGETITTAYISTTGGLDTGATVYYALSTPTTTEITDTTLIGQLEAILAKHTNKNVTNAWIEPSGTNAQAGLTLTYRQDIQTRLDNLETAILSL